jgi:hypothetical protein
VVIRFKNNRLKWLEWLKRYGWAEAWGTIGSYLGFFIARRLTGSDIAASYGAALGENFGFYGCMIAVELKYHKRQGHHWSASALTGIGRKLVYEFGGAELLDFSIVRPGSTFLAVALFGNRVGVFIGKVAADMVFYTLAISFYERRKSGASKS